jgi:uncharacterized protein
VLETAAMFGLGVDDERSIAVVEPCAIDWPLSDESNSRGRIVFITGPSGSGKSTVLRLIAQRVEASGRAVKWLDRLPQLPEVPLVDVLGDSLEEATSLLSLAGLGDAFVMLRTPSQLSDGQRARLRIAQAMHAAGARSCTMFADEFCATLDRLTARTLCRNFRRWINGVKCTFVAATSHDDLLEALEPDMLMWKGLDRTMEVMRR